MFHSQILPHLSQFEFSLNFLTASTRLIIIIIIIKLLLFIIKVVF